MIRCSQSDCNSKKFEVDRMVTFVVDEHGKVLATVEVHTDDHSGITCDECGHSAGYDDEDGEPREDWE